MSTVEEATILTMICMLSLACLIVLRLLGAYFDRASERREALTEEVSGTMFGGRWKYNGDDGRWHDIGEVKDDTHGSG